MITEHLSLFRIVEALGGLSSTLHTAEGVDIAFRPTGDWPGKWRARVTILRAGPVSTLITVHAQTFPGLLRDLAATLSETTLDS